jgi:hypothetical protein
VVTLEARKVEEKPAKAAKPTKAKAAPVTAEQAAA